VVGTMLKSSRRRGSNTRYILLHQIHHLDLEAIDRWKNRSMDSRSRVLRLESKSTKDFTALLATMLPDLLSSMAPTLNNVYNQACVKKVL
jgi:hypothetical protein